MFRTGIAITLILALAIIPAAAIDKQQKGAVKLVDPEKTADALLAKADSVFQSRDYKSALTDYMEVAEAAHNEFNRSVEAEALAQVARMHLILGDKEEGRNWLVRAQDKATDSDPMGWSRLLGVKGRFEWKDNDLTAAHKTFDKMYQYCTTNGLYGRAVDAAHMIAIVAEDPEDQIRWSRLGIEAAEASDSENWLGPLWNNLAGIYYDQKQFDSALDCYIKAREYHWRFSDEYAKLFADYHIGMTYRLLEKYDEAGKWLRPVLAWAERIELHSAIGQACEDLGEIEIAKGNKQAGEALLKRARDEYKAAGYDESWKEIWEHINKRLTELQR